jgi:hypothetical protein
MRATMPGRSGQDTRRMNDLMFSLYHRGPPLISPVNNGPGSHGSVSDLL